MKRHPRKPILRSLSGAALAAILASSMFAGPSLKLTILYDNTSATPECRADWGFACLVEGIDKTILFDAGAKAEIFAGNTAALEVDFAKIGAVVVSHAHGDHTAGLVPALAKMKGTPVFLPPSSPAALVDAVKQGGGDVRSSKHPVEVCRDALLSGELTRPIPEQALIVRTPRGLVVITGCSHPGIVKILERAREVGKQDLYAVIGGFHLLEHSEGDVREIIKRFKELGIVKVGATHCTGPRAIELFREAFGSGFVEAGAGRIIEFP